MNMKKIKALLFALVGVLMLTFAIVKVSAEGATEEFDASTQTVSSDKNGVAVGTAAHDGSLFTLSTANKAAYISCLGGGDGANEKPLETGTFNATTVDGTKTYTKALISNATTANPNGYTLTAKKNIKFTVYFTIADASIVKGTSVSATTSKEGEIVLGTTPVTVSPTKKLFGTAYSTTDTLSSGESLFLGSSKNRLVIFGIVAEETSVVTPTYTVTIYQENKVLSEESVKEGVAYTPSIKLWGYNVVGYYTDSALTQAFTSGSTLTADQDLYVKTTAWDPVENPNNLTSELVGKVNGIYNLGQEVELTSTYTLLAGTGYTTSNKKGVITTGSAVSTTKNAIKVNAASAGTLSIVITGGSSARDAKVLNAEGIDVQVSTGNPVWDATAAAAWEQRTLTYELSQGTYFVGGTNGMRIFSMTFTPSATVDATFLQQEGQKDDARFVRYITIVNGIDEADLDFTLHITGTNIDMNANCVIANKLTNNGEVYSAEVNGQPYTFDVKDGTLYIICVLGVKGGAVSGDFSGVEITATMTVNGQELPAKTYVIPTE